MKKELTINELDKIIEDINKLWEQPKEEKLLTKEEQLKILKTKWKIKENERKKNIEINKRIDELDRKHLEKLKEYPNLQKDFIEFRNKWNKKYNFRTYLNEINSMDLQNQPSTSKCKQNSLKV